MFLSPYRRSTVEISKRGCDSVAGFMSVLVILGLIRIEEFSEILVELIDIETRWEERERARFMQRLTELFE